MTAATQTMTTSHKSAVAGWIISGLSILFLVFDGITKIAVAQPVVQAMTQLGFKTDQAPAIGILLLICTLIYTIPRTAILGAVLLTGYLGGAVAVQFRVGNPVFETIFPVLFGILVWLGVYFRDQRAKNLI